jgi:hypothetical protein
MGDKEEEEPTSHESAGDPDSEEPQDIPNSASQIDTMAELNTPTSKMTISAILEDGHSGMSDETAGTKLPTLPILSTTPTNLHIQSTTKPMLVFATGVVLPDLFAQRGNGPEKWPKTTFRNKRRKITFKRDRKIPSRNRNYSRLPSLPYRVKLKIGSCCPPFLHSNLICLLLTVPRVIQLTHQPTLSLLNYPRL